MYRVYGEYYIPKHKYQLIDILSVKYPKNRQRFNDMPIEQLLAIYHSYRRRLNEKVSKEGMAEIPER